MSGIPQRVYAKKIVFKEEEICEGMYSADVDFFHAQYEKFAPAKRKSFPKKRFTGKDRQLHVLLCKMGKGSHQTTLPALAYVGRRIRYS